MGSTDRLFNEILQSGEVIPEWLIGIIVPIYKKGSKLDPSNYRGSYFYQFLMQDSCFFTHNQSILVEIQLGFVPGNRTSDAHIIINNLVKKICHKSNSKIYSCFVDLKWPSTQSPVIFYIKKTSSS